MSDKHGGNIATKPRPYDLADPAEFKRLMRESAGYLRTCRREHHGTDLEGRNFAIAALEELHAAGRPS